MVGVFHGNFRRSFSWLIEVCLEFGSSSGGWLCADARSMNRTWTFLHALQRRGLESAFLGLRQCDVWRAGAWGPGFAGQSSADTEQQALIRRVSGDSSRPIAWSVLIVGLFLGCCLSYLGTERSNAALGAKSCRCSFWYGFFE